MQKYFIAAAAVVIQLALGGIYAWSSFVPALISEYHLTSMQTQLIFGLTIACFTVSMTAASKVLTVLGPRLTSTIGGALFGAGHLLASQSGGSYLLLLIGIAGISGIGIGFGYICPMSTSIAWFPQRKGLITGIVVAGFGAGAVVLSNVVNAALAAGIDVLPIFGWIGVVYGVVVVAAAQFLSLPKGYEPKALGRDQNTVSEDFLRSRAFKLLSAAMFCGTFAGLLVVGNLGPMALIRGASGQLATWSVAAFAIGNGLGRLSWGWLFDRYQQMVLPLSLWALAVVVTVLTLSGLPMFLFPFVAGAIGFGFGANFVVFAATITQRFGPQGLARYYPWVFLFYGLAGISGPAMGGLLFDLSGSYQGAVWLAAIVASFGALLVRGAVTKVNPVKHERAQGWNQNATAED